MKKEKFNLYEFIDIFLDNKSLTQKKELFKNNLNNLEFILSSSSKYKNRDLLSDDLKGFYDEYECVKNSEWEFSHLNIQSEEQLGYEIGYELIKIGEHSGGDLYNKKYTNLIYDDDNTSEVYSNNEYGIDFYSYMLKDIFLKKYSHILCAEEFKE